MKKLTLATLMLLSTSAMANLVQNGSFEDLSGFNLGNSAWGLSSALAGWTNNTGDQFEIQVATNFQSASTGNFSAFNSSFDGAHYLELNANQLGSISQILKTTAGQTYHLTFGYSGRSDSGAGNDSLANVYWGGSMVTPTILDAAPNSGWQTYDFTVVATGAVTELRFASVGPTNKISYGSYLDGVLVTAVPEPGTIALMLSGLGLIGLVRHRSNNKLT